MLNGRLDLLFGSAELFGRSDASSSMCVLMLSQPLAVNKTLSAISALIRSFSSVKPLVNLQFLCSGIAFSTDITNKRPALNVGLVMCV